MLTIERPYNANRELARMAAISRHPLATVHRGIAEQIAFTPGLEPEEAVWALEHAIALMAPEKFTMLRPAEFPAYPNGQRSRAY
ncbi:hypothetical protein [Bosea massiliensis]|uniref:Uncharacterized protein n=1 Tax=Bosea massiliensis TaxID=151419 RepID=A0ABW0P8D3_9HYPH